MFAKRVKEAAVKLKADPLYSIEILNAGFRITYTFPAAAKWYVHENFTPFRAVEHSQHNPLIMAMNDLKDSSMTFKKKIEA